MTANPEIEAELLVRDIGQIEIRRRPRQRNMNLSVRADGSIRVSCNLRRSQREILSFVASCRNFIEKRRARLAELDRLHPRPQFLSGETLLWFGERVRLDVIWSWSERIRARRVELRGSLGGLSGEFSTGKSFAGEHGKVAFELTALLTSNVKQRQEAVVKIYKKEARRWFESRLHFFAGLMGVKPISLSVRGQKTLWGSCTGAGAISLNWKLLCCPAEIIDYVVVHELAHIRHRNHSAQFWEFVERFDPHYKAHRAALKSMEPIIGRMFL